MESLDEVRKRFEALEQQTEQLKQQTHVLARQARWWRGIACGLGLLGLVSLPLQSGTAADTQPRGMAERMATLEKKLGAMTFDDTANEVVITGANLRIVNGLGTTDTTNGVGNLIVGYNELRPPGDAPPNNRTGSHNVVLGKQNNFTSFGGLVVGQRNEISGEFATISGGFLNTASGDFASISGGSSNAARGPFSSVSGGLVNRATGDSASISGGGFNTASGNTATISGGGGNRATGDESSVSGGVQNTASGVLSSVSGGEHNTASGQFSSVSGGNNRSAPATDNWAAGTLFSDN
jgi:hypothetical protein